MTNHERAVKLARGIFAVGDEPIQHGGMVQRIQFMGGTYPDRETKLGGLSEIALISVLHRLIDQLDAQSEEGNVG